MAQKGSPVMQPIVHTLLSIGDMRLHACVWVLYRTVYSHKHRHPPDIGTVSSFPVARKRPSYDNPHFFPKTCHASTHRFPFWTMSDPSPKVEDLEAVASDGLKLEQTAEMRQREMRQRKVLYLLVKYARELEAIQKTILHNKEHGIRDLKSFQKNMFLAQSIKTLADFFVGQAYAEPGWMAPKGVMSPLEMRSLSVEVSGALRRIAEIPADIQTADAFKGNPASSGGRSHSRIRRQAVGGGRRSVSRRRRSVSRRRRVLSYL